LPKPGNEPPIWSFVILRCIQGADTEGEGRACSEHLIKSANKSLLDEANGRYSALAVFDTLRERKRFAEQLRLRPCLL
ncbi:MAG: hypothetical protein MUF63_14690, partial [Rhodobacteraceae bacterium]|nr:hypothetical protein [Paracoccaceae bacterium]